MSEHAHATNDPGPLGPLTRRKLLEVGAALGAGAVVGGSLFVSAPRAEAATAVPFQSDPLDDDPNVRIVYTTCQMCHSRCGLKCKVYRPSGTYAQPAVLLKIDGNPYNPTNAEIADGTHAQLLPYSASDPSDAAIRRKRGRICGKAQAGVEMLYNPSRVRTPLKRFGPRGGGKWVAITWAQAVDEIVNGGTIDNDDGTTYAFTGLKALRLPDDNTDAAWIGGSAYLVDKKTGQAIAPFTATTLDDSAGGMTANAYAGMDLLLTGGTGQGQRRRITKNSAATFTVAAAWTTTPDASTTYVVQQGDLGRRTNQVMYSPGRQPNGNGDFTQRLWKDGYGTANFRLDHTSICETSHHVAMAFQTAEPSGRGAGAQAGNTAFHPDLDRARYVIFFGENPAEAGFPHQSYARKVIEALTRPTNPAQIAVVDPRLSNTAAIVRQNGGLWVSPKPGTDAAIALGMIAWIMENTIHDGNTTGASVKYLKNLNQKAAAAAGETTYTDACYLVDVSTKTLLDASKIGGTAGNYVAVVGGAAVEVAPLGATALAGGTLAVSNQTAGGATCSSVYSLLKEQAFAGRATAMEAVTYWAGIAGISPSDIVQMAQGFAREDRACMASYYRGACQHTHGTYTSMAINSLNWLCGNVDRPGGVSAGGSFSKGSVAINETVNPKMVPLGPRIDRAGTNHTDVAKFLQNGPDAGQTPTKRAWFPFASNGVFQEMVPSIGQPIGTGGHGYPYACKALFTQWNIWPYSVPGGKAVAEKVLLDTSQVPLHVAIDVQLGALTAMSDYVLPEVTFLETYALPNVFSLIKEGETRVPVVGQYFSSSAVAYKDVCEFTDYADIATGTEANAVWGATPYFRPILPETRQHADILLHLLVGTNGISPSNNVNTPGHVPGFGTDGIAAGKSLWTAWDFFKELFNNYATAAPALALATPTSVPANALTQVSRMLLRGGRWESDPPSGTLDPTIALDPANQQVLRNKFGSLTSPKIIHICVEAFAKKRSSQVAGTVPLPHWSSIPTYDIVRDARGNAVTDTAFALQLITFKLSWHGQGRTATEAVLTSLSPENSIWINASDAAFRGIVLGDRVRLTSASDPIGVVARANVTHGIAPGVVGVSHHFGHWESGTRSHVVSGVATTAYPARAGGITVNPILRIDPVFNDVSLQDYIGGSVSFYDTRVNVVKA